MDASFAASAEAVCQPFADYTKTDYLRLAGFNRYAADAALLPRVAAHLEHNRAYADLLTELQALGHPESGADAWATVLDDLHTTAADTKAAIADARNANPGRFADLATELDQDTTKLHADLGAAGLADSSCVAAEGDPLKPPPANEG